jgi:hypothetical protein
MMLNQTDSVVTGRVITNDTFRIAMLSGVLHDSLLSVRLVADSGCVGEASGTLVWVNDSLAGVVDIADCRGAYTARFDLERSRSPD